MTNILTDTKNIPFICKETNQGIILESSISGFHNTFYLDYSKGSLGYRLDSKRVLHEPLAKLVDKNDWVLDATAGIARDSLILALLGCKVWSCEAHPLISELVTSGLKRALNSHNLSTVLENTDRFKFFAATDALNLLKDLKDKKDHERPDIVYLDPMFPEKQKTSSAKKEMKWLQLIHAQTKTMYPDFSLSPCEDVFLLALEVANKRVIIKRPPNADYLIKSPIPSFSRKVQSARFDVYLTTNKNHITT